VSSAVGGTLLEAWASHESFQPKYGPRGPFPPGRNAEVDFYGQRRTNETHVSPTDPEARMARKSMATAAKLSYAGHLLIEHRNELIVDIELTQATGYTERKRIEEPFGWIRPPLEVSPDGRTFREIIDTEGVAGLKRACDSQ
jgi:hypothetical protein